MRIAALIMLLVFSPGETCWAFNYDAVVLYGSPKNIPTYGPRDDQVMVIVSKSLFILPDKNQWTIKSSEEQD